MIAAMTETNRATASRLTRRLGGGGGQDGGAVRHCSPEAPTSDPAGGKGGGRIPPGPGWTNPTLRPRGRRGGRRRRCVAATAPATEVGDGAVATPRRGRPPPSASQPHPAGAQEAGGVRSSQPAGRRRDGTQRAAAHRRERAALALRRRTCSTCHTPLAASSRLRPTERRSTRRIPVWPARPMVRAIYPGRRPTLGPSVRRRPPGGRCSALRRGLFGGGRLAT